MNTELTNNKLDQCFLIDLDTGLYIQNQIITNL